MAADANAFVDGNKLTDLSDPLDTTLESDISDEVIGSLSSAFDVSTWVDNTTTPNLVKRIIAMKFIGWLFDKTYSENEETSNYGQMLRSEADKLLQGLIAGSIQLLTIPPEQILDLGSVSFEPTDADCGPLFTVGQVF